MEQRTLDDVTRIENWLKSPIGKKWAGNQAYLQGLNPRPETRTWDKSSILNSIAPFLHADRHLHGFVSDGESYEKYEPLIDGDMAKYGFGIRFGDGADYGEIGQNVSDDDSKSRLTRLTNEFIIPEVVASIGTGFFGGIASGIAGAIGGLFSGTATGMPPVTPSHDVKSQGGPFGESSIWTRDGLAGGYSPKYDTTPYHLLGNSKYLTSASPEAPEKPFTDLGDDYIKQLKLSSAMKSDEADQIKKTERGTGTAAGTIKAIEASRLKTAVAAYEKEKSEHHNWEGYQEAIGKTVNDLGKIFKTLGTPGAHKALVTKMDDQTGLGMIRINDGEDLLKTNYKTVATDNINMIPYGQNYSDDDKDFIKFKFKDLVNDQFIIFRAILSGISDSITPEWEATRYIGRPDDVHVYTGTSRSVSFSFNIYPNTKQEFPVLLEKLNYLVGLCYPTYTEQNRMVAPFIDLTIGDMFVNTPGFLSSLSVDVDDVSTWETWNQVTESNGALEGLKIAQARGLIDHIGISSHDLSILEKAIISGLFETVMLEYSAFYNKTYHLINKAKERDIGVIVMRPLGGSGRMSRLRNLMKSLEQPSEINSNILLQYVLSNPNISVVIPGCSYPSRIKENVQLALTYSPFSSAQQKYCENLAVKFSKYE